ncbi:hypothetical protein [Bacillus sp. 2205SS5-2]|uniref:hypothetical protein n=1 Tax=Bacillus sp. 2205SS5-2 TaxID=3109031 RepID=UPI003006FA6F
MILLLLLIIGISFSIHYRYTPTNCKKKSCQTSSDLTWIDVRDYQESNASPVESNFHIPCGYIYRHSHEIKANQVGVIASSKIEKNVAVRMLRKKGLQVVNCRVIPADVSAKSSYLNVS